MIGELKAIYRRQVFYPQILGVFLNPFYLARKGLASAMYELAPRLSGNLLDVGCGSKPYRELFSVETYTGLDIDSENSRKRAIADAFYDGEKFPFSNAAFDCVLCNQVLEHVFNPSEFLGEINRVLPSGGLLLLTVPFVWDEHEQPYDYARYSSFGLKSLLERGGFAVVEHRKLGADASTICQLINAYLYKVTQHWPKYSKLVLTGSLMSFINLLGLLARRVLPGNPDLFLDHVVLAEKIK